MDISETTAFVTAANQTDPRVELDDMTVQRWHRLIGDLHPADAAAALDQHYRASTDRVMPADIRRLVNGAPDAGRRASYCRSCGTVHPEDACPQLIGMPDWFRPTVTEWARRARAAGKFCPCKTPDHEGHR
jgi:hypothetical protein